MTNKKGVGAVIAWVLLLGFTVALATTVFLWMKGQTETLTEGTVEHIEGELQCQNVRINVINKTDANPPCSKLEIHNLGYLKIDEVVVRELCTDGSAKSTPQPHTINLEPKSSKTETSGSYKKTLSDVFCDGVNSCNQLSCEKLEVMPVILIPNRKVGCKDRTVVVEC